MKIELIHPPHYNSCEDRLDPPLGLLSIASYLRRTLENNVEVRVTDLSGQQISQWDIGKADIYGITVYAASLSEMGLIAQTCKTLSPESVVVVGGAHPSAVPMSEHFINNEAIDYVVVGEGEPAMCEIANGYRPDKKVIVSDGSDGLFLFPSFDLIDISSYHRKIDGLSSLPLLTSKGCFYRCAFCGLQKMHDLTRTVRLASPEHIFEQIQKIKNEFGISAINFQDDMFTLQKRNLFRLLSLLKPLNIKFRCHGRAGHDNEEVYKKLADAGCVQVSWGIESGSQYILDRMNKQSFVEDNLDVIRWAKKYGITSRAFFVIGFPGETRETIEETKRFIEFADPDQYFVSSMVPYPGTDVWADPDKYGITEISKDWSQFYQVDKDGLGGLTFDTQWLSREQFRDLEIEFREWIRARGMRGKMQDYERRIYGSSNLN